MENTHLKIPTGDHVTMELLMGEESCKDFKWYYWIHCLCYLAKSLCSAKSYDEGKIKVKGINKEK